MATPFDQRQKALAAKGSSKPKVTVDEALAVLRSAVTSPQAQAALKTLEGNLQGGPENKGAPPKSGGPPSKQDIAQRMGAAKGGNSAPFERRAKRAKATATAKGY